MPWLRVTNRSTSGEDSDWIYVGDPLPTDEKVRDEYLRDVWRDWLRREHPWALDSERGAHGECFEEVPPIPFLDLKVREAEWALKAAQAHLNWMKTERNAQAAMPGASTKVISDFRCSPRCFHKFEAEVIYNERGGIQHQTCPKCGNTGAYQTGALHRG